MTALAILHRDEIIAGLQQGKRLSDLGIPCSRQAISAALKHDKEYREAIELGFHVRLDTAEKAIEDAPEAIDVARARARFEAVRWRAEREFPEVWANKQQIIAQVQVSSIDSLLADSAREVLSVAVQALPNNEAGESA